MYREGNPGSGAEVYKWNGDGFPPLNLSRFKGESENKNKNNNNNNNDNKYNNKNNNNNGNKAGDTDVKYTEAIDMDEK